MPNIPAGIIVDILEVGLLNLTSTTNVTRVGGGINWCSLPYAPMSTVPLGNYTNVGWQSGGMDYGLTPQSLIAYMNCFNASVPAAERAAGNAAYICQVNDVLTGGSVEGFTRFQAKSAGDRNREMGLSVKGAMLSGMGCLATMLL
jgi:hypothetical protein